MNWRKYAGRALSLGLSLSLVVGGLVLAEGGSSVVVTTTKKKNQSTVTTVEKAPSTEQGALSAVSTDLQPGAASPTDLAALIASPTDLAATPTDLAATPTDLGLSLADVEGNYSIADLIALFGSAEDQANLVASPTDLDEVIVIEDLSWMAASPTDLDEVVLVEELGATQAASPSDLDEVIIIEDLSWMNALPANQDEVALVEELGATQAASPTDLSEEIVVIEDLSPFYEYPTEIGTAASTYLDPWAEGNTWEEDTSPKEEPIDQDFTDLKVGDIIRMGYYEQDGNEENLREPIEWQVLSVNKRKKVALVTTVYALETLPYGTLGNEAEYEEPGFNWQNSGIRQWLSEEFYDRCFTDAEIRRIRLASNVTKDPSGRFTTKDFVFLLSQEEARRYMKSTQGMSCEATPYVLAKLGADSAAIAEDGYCRWWVRELTKAVKTNKKGEKVNNGSVNEAGYVYGGKGMAKFLRNEGAKTYEADQALVRPAMWIRYD
ncbi:MAG: hypothetical protein IJ188_05250 [Clostridia bacterium]|nr:hypothetical protein [Clostridia bacterium]